MLTSFSFSESDVCTQAASFWQECQTAQTNFSATEPGVGTRQCLCNPNTATPDHAENWWSKLNACVQCVEQALGDGIGSTSGPLDGLFQGFCNQAFPKGSFIQQARQLQQESGFPLRLPEAILSTGNAAGGAARRAADGSYLPGTQAFSQIAHVYTTPSTTTATIIQTVAPIECNHDNCLRSFMRAGPPATSFCSEYTTDTALASSLYGLPDYAMSCWGNNHFKISSACTCLNSIATQTSIPAKATTDSVTTKPKITSSSASVPTSVSRKLTASISRNPTASSCDQQSSSSSKSASIASTSALNSTTHHTRTTTVTSWITIYSKLTRSSTPTNFHDITRTTDLLTKTETLSSSYKIYANTTSKSNQPTYTVKASSSPTSKTSSATSSAATKGPSSPWITLPASDAMVKCSSKKTRN